MNDQVDKEAKLATKLNQAHYANIPHKDYYTTFRRLLRVKWQTEWRNIGNNKLRLLKDTVTGWQSSRQKTRKHEVVLASLRMEHTLLTHGYLMESGHMTYCGDCVVPLNGKHVLVECLSYQELRLRHYPSLATIQSSDLAHQWCWLKIRTSHSI